MDKFPGLGFVAYEGGGLTVDSSLLVALLHN
jgi:hypothetical protein